MDSDNRQTPIWCSDSVLGHLIAGFDWGATSLGPINRWPASMTSILAFVLKSPQPMVTLWGDEGVMIYNDAYRDFAGQRHPALLGSKVLEGWSEVADFNRNVMQKVYREGGTLSFKDQELVLVRDGTPRRMWTDLEYSPAYDEHGEPIGVVAVVIETTARVLAARRQQDERRRLLQMAEYSPSFMALLEGPEHRIVMHNPAYQRLIGDRSVLGRTVAEALPDAQAQGFVELLDQVYRTQEPFHTNNAKFVVQARKDGSKVERFVDFVYQPVEDENGRCGGVFVSGVDITERIVAQDAIQASDAQFKIFAQVLPNHIWTAGADGMLDWFNDRVLQYSGQSPEQLAGTGWTRIVHPDDLEHARERWLSSLAEGEPYQTEFRIRRTDGVYRWHLVRAVPIHDDAGRVIRWIGTNTDIHEHKESLAQSKADRQRLWTLSPILKAVTDQGGIIIDVNPAWTSVLGWSREATVGKRTSDFLIEDARSPTATTREGPAEPPVLDGRTSLRTRDGGHRLIHWTNVAEEDRYYGFGRDITAEVASAAALAEAEAALRQSQKMEAVGQLTGGIAHDFNNLLQAITGSLEVVRRLGKQGRTGEMERFIDGATSAAKRAAALTHRLLAFSRRQPLDPKPLRADERVFSMEDLFRRTLGERVELELAADDDLWLTRCDPNQLENAILNLVINARDAMPNGGRLTIETCNAEIDALGAAKERGMKAGAYVRITVSDSGIGMDSDTMAKAFEPFFTTKPIGEGTGLGLSMVYGFAQQSGGHVAIHSEVGRGTKVKLYLPRYQGEDSSTSEAPESDAVPGAPAGETILVVEDESVVRGVIVEELRQLGYRAMEAGNSDEGLEILNSPATIDLLVTDLGLPGVGGRQLADAARESRPNLRVLFMTGYAKDGTLNMDSPEPGMEIIAKPFAMRALATRLRSMLTSKR